MRGLARGYNVKCDAARDLLAALEAVSQHRPFIARTVGRLAILSKRTHDFHLGRKLSDVAYLTEVSYEAANR